MTSAAHSLRTALDAHRQRLGRDQLARLRSGAVPPQPPDEAGRFLRSASAHQALLEAYSQAEVDEEALDRLREQLAFAVWQSASGAAGRAAREALAGASLSSGEPLRLPDELSRLSRGDDPNRRRALARELEQACEAASGTYVEGCARAEALLLERWHELGGDGEPPWWPSDELRVAAGALLSDTEEAMRESLEWAMRGAGRGEPHWDRVVRALRAPELDSPAGSRSRWRRVAMPLSTGESGHALTRRMRAEVLPGAATPVCRVLCLAVPGDVRVAQADVDHGVASDVLAAEGLGRGLGLALILPRAPAEVRWPMQRSAAGALGMLSMQLWGDRLQLSRVQGMSAAEAERVGRLSATLTLAWTRVACALCLLPRAELEEPRVRVGAIETALGRALGVGVPPALAGLVGGDLLTATARARDALAGLSWHVALRERHDEDWFRNPRAAEAIAGAAMRGNRLDALSLCEELSVGLGAARERLLELLA